MPPSLIRNPPWLRVLLACESICDDFSGFKALSLRFLAAAEKARI